MLLVTKTFQPPKGNMKTNGDGKTACLRYGSKYLRTLSLSVLLSFIGVSVSGCRTNVEHSRRERCWQLGPAQILNSDAETIVLVGIERIVYRETWLAEPPYVRTPAAVAIIRINQLGQIDCSRIERTTDNLSPRLAIVFPFDDRIYWLISGSRDRTEKLLVIDDCAVRLATDGEQVALKQRLGATTLDFGTAAPRIEALTAASSYHHVELDLSRRVHVIDGDQFVIRQTANHQEIRLRRGDTEQLLITLDPTSVELKATVATAPRHGS